MKRITFTLVALLVAAGVFWLFPLFHIVRLDAREAVTKQESFNAAEYANKFWNDRLLPWLNDAPAASEQFFFNYRTDPQKAREQFGRTVGVSRAHLLVLRATGTIVTVEPKSVVVKITDEKGETTVVLQTGLLFGNTIRDATGLLDAGDFPNSQHYNELSTELNRMVETRVIPKLKEQAATGRKIEFVGCAQVSDAAAAPQPLKIIPLQVKVD